METDTDREVRLEEAEQDIRHAMHGVDPYGSYIDGVGYTDQQNLEDGDKALDWLLSEIDRLKAKLEGEDEQD